MADTKSESLVNRLTFEEGLRSEEAAEAALIKSIVLRTQADLTNTGDYFPQELTLPGAEALAREVAKTMLVAAQRGGVELSVFEEHFIGTADEQASECIDAMKVLPDQSSDIDIEQLIQGLPAERTEA